MCARCRRGRGGTSARTTRSPKLSPHLPTGGASWTGSAPLPGGDFAVDQFDGQVATLIADYPFIGRETAWRLARAYGTLAGQVLAGARSLEDLGQQFGAGLSEREVRYLVRHELARTATDILWRRTKLGLRLDKAAAARLQAWLGDNVAGIECSTG